MNNDLTGLDLDGFKDNDIEFDPLSIKDKDLLNSVRAIIQKYFDKKSSFNRKYDSYALKKMIERINGRYLSNGLLIYAMYLEGFKVLRYKTTVNSLFNVSQQSLNNYLDYGDVYPLLAWRTNNIYIDEKRYSIYKYPFKALIAIRFYSKKRLKAKVSNVIALELNVGKFEVDRWFTCRKNSHIEIPKGSLSTLLELFNLPEYEYNLLKEDITNIRRVFL